MGKKNFKPMERCMAILLAVLLVLNTAPDSLITTYAAPAGETSAQTPESVSEGDADEYTVSAPAVAGGTITLNGQQVESVTVDEDSVVTLSVTADTGWHIVSVSIGGEMQTVDNDVAFSKDITVTADITVDVVFGREYVVTVTHNANGTVVTDPVTDAGSVTISSGSDIEIVADPNDNYRVSEVKINGQADPAVTGENYSNTDVYEKTITVEEDYTIDITFAPNRYKVTATDTTNGTISIANEAVDYNENSDITVSPAEGYSVSTLQVNGVDVTEFGIDDAGVVSLAVANITEDKQISATFVPTETIAVDIPNMFNSGEAFRLDERTYVYNSGEHVTFTTDKTGIRLYASGNQIVGDAGQNSVTFDETVSISKIQLRYQAANELGENWHTVSDIIDSAPLKIFIDDSECNITIGAEDKHANEYYNDSFEVSLEVVADDDINSGIASVEYFVTDVEIGDEVTYDEVSDQLKTASDVLYIYPGDTAINTYEQDITIDVDEDTNNSDYVAVWFKVVECSGMVTYARTENYKVNCTAPVLQSVSMNGILDENAQEGYYDDTRTATIVIKDRASTFDEAAATENITITAVNKDTQELAICKAGMISWDNEGDIHTATIEFCTEANYTWDISYTNKAGKTMDKSQVIEIGDSIYSFTVDKSAPTGTIQLDEDNKWDKLLSALTFRVWKNYSVTATATPSDTISGLYNISYYKSDATELLGETELESLYVAGDFREEKYTISADEKCVIYARIMDYSGRTTYISTGGLIVDLRESKVSVQADAATNESGIYNDNVRVDIVVNDSYEGIDSYSGIQKIEYKVIKDKNYANPTQEGVLYSFSYEPDKENDEVGTITVIDWDCEKQKNTAAVKKKGQYPTEADLRATWSGYIVVDAALNNSDRIEVIVTATDNTGKKIEGKLEDLAINVDTIKAKITLDGTAFTTEDDCGHGTAAATKDDCGYFAMKYRTAKIEIEDRYSSFDAEEATEGIQVEVVGAVGAAQDNSYTISGWKSDGNKHTATITFLADAHYEWSFSYTNKAGNTLEEGNISTGQSDTPFHFTVDKTKPTGTISVAENTWDKLLEKLTFGIYSKVKVQVSATANDDTSPKKIEYYKTSEPLIFSEKQLSELYRQGKFKLYRDAFYVEPNEQFTVYARITDYAGNYIYINSDGIILDKVNSTVSITPEAANEKGIYGADYTKGIKVDIEVADEAPYSGIQKIEYKVVADGKVNTPTQSGTLYSFDYTREQPDENGRNTNGGTLIITDWNSRTQKNTRAEKFVGQYPEQSQLKSSWEGTLVVDPGKNNSSNVVVYITVTDNAGNVTTVESEKLDIDVTAPLVEVSFDNNKDNNGNGYFKDNDSKSGNAVRTATVMITEREGHFKSTVATKGIVVEAVDAAGKTVKDAYSVSKWTETKGKTPDETKYTAKVKFLKDANYTWSVTYTDDAGNVTGDVETGTSVAPFKFTIDTVQPNGTVTAKSTEGRTEEWSKLRGTDELLFGFWSKDKIVISGSFDDATSPKLAAIDYYKVKATATTKTMKALSTKQLDAVTGWKKFSKLTVKDDEQFIVYIRITDMAGNYRYISTNGLIVDHNAPMEEALAPVVTVTPQQPVNDIYSGDVNVAVQITDPLVGNTYSGLKKIWYEVKNMGKVTQSATLYEFANSNPTQEDLLQTWGGSITVDSQKNNSDDVEIVVHAQDNAANSSEAAVTVKIDTIKPTVMVSFDNNAADSTNLFKTGRTATIVVTERNFSAEDMNISITNTDGAIPKVSDFAKSGGTGNGDDTKWTATVNFAADGDYTFDITCQDKAHNACESVSYAGDTIAPNAFTIDQTLPVIAVRYDNNDAQNGNYYNAVRTATVVITEHNFNAERVTITNTAVNGGAQVALPTVSNWVTDGDEHIATIYYGQDAKYTFDIAVTDSAGNASADYAEESFYVDTIMPALEITGVADKSANSGDVIPVVAYSDANYDAEQVVISLVGANNKEVALDGAYTDNGNGGVFTFNNFAREQSVDDIYTLTATLTDKAGNTSEEAITFSVNRFGSTYAMSEEAQALNGTYTKESGDVIVTETNANALNNIKLVLFKNNETITLAEGDDYALDISGGNGKWYQYTYTVFAQNFVDDGVYRLAFHSEDDAGNIAENTLDTKNTEISFGIDKTQPNILITNLEAGETYPLEEMSVMMSISDNLLLGTITVYLDDFSTPYKTWSAEEIATIIGENGEFSFDISGDSKNAHEIKVVCVDAAGNEQVEIVDNFYVTTDLFVRYYTNKPLLIGSIAGVVAVAGLIIFLIVYKKRRKEAGK